jgi:acrylyl-CoA reductase (NADPH)
LRAMSVEARLGDVPRIAADILKGQVRGRIVVDVRS